MLALACSSEMPGLRLAITRNISAAGFCRFPRSTHDVIGTPEIHGLTDRHTSKARGSDTNNCVWVAAHAHRLAQRGGITGESPLPESKADHHGVGRRKVFFREGAADHRGNAQNCEVVARDRGEVNISQVDLPEFEAGAGASGSHGQHAREDLVAIAGRLIHGVTESSSTGPRQFHQLLRVADRQHAHQYGVDQAEDGGVRADREGQRKDRRQREAG
jgi:hypothetical protein